MNRLVIVLVFALAAVASAADASIGFVAPAVVTPGQVVTINLVADSPCYGFMIDTVSDAGKGGTASNIVFADGLVLASPGELENSPNGVLFFCAGAYTQFDSPIAAGAAILSFSYHVPALAEGSITIAPLPGGTEWYSARDNTWYVAQESHGALTPYAEPLTPIMGVTMQVVPEPATLLLLGLGGLAMRRRM